jgi:dTDP-4-dehydrorhamnose reductase
MIILLGGSGYIGSAFQRFLQARGLTYRVIRRNEIDYTQIETLTAFLQREQPSFLINAAGYTGRPNVDACELHKTECLFGNAVLPGIIQEACARVNLPWGHVSSGCIYTGTRAAVSGFQEDDAPNFTFRQNNCSFYSGTKALGEEVLAGAPCCYLWRLRIPFNEVDGPRNYLSKLMRYDRLLEARNSISQLDEFVRAGWECWERRVPFGTYNITNPGSVTTHEVVELIRRSDRCRKEFSYFNDEADFMHKAGKTPRSNCVLDSSKLLATGIRLTEVHEAIESSLRHWVAQK